MEHLEIVKTEKQIQNKWDSMLCRWVTTKMRLKESYYEIARFATGTAFRGSRKELQLFVIGLDLKRFIEIMPRKAMQLARHDMKNAMSAHCKRFVADLYRIGAIDVLLNIESYNWEDLTHKRVMIKEAPVFIARCSSQFDRKGGIGKNCSDWGTVK